jgi:hypothetical protein
MRYDIIFIFVATFAVAYLLGFYMGVKKASYKAFKFAKARSNAESFRDGVAKGLKLAEVANKIKVIMDGEEK